ncbi:hypothetical protein BD560DRAFT_428456 [Blakeslea trispora]|nr:hypothetical protein BD560DRAFT_428456 [Blakeslea trispora]
MYIDILKNVRPIVVDKLEEDKKEIDIEKREEKQVEIDMSDLPLELELRLKKEAKRKRKFRPITLTITTPKRTSTAAKFSGGRRLFVQQFGVRCTKVIVESHCKSTAGPLLVGTRRSLLWTGQMKCLPCPQ